MHALCRKWTQYEKTQKAGFRKPDKVIRYKPSTLQNYTLQRIKEINLALHGNKKTEPFDSGEYGFCFY